MSYSIYWLKKRVIKTFSSIMGQWYQGGELISYLRKYFPYYMMIVSRSKLIWHILASLKKGGKSHVQETAEERPRSCRVRIDSGSGRHRYHHHFVGPWSRHRQCIQHDRQQHLRVPGLFDGTRTTARRNKLGCRFIDPSR